MSESRWLIDIEGFQDLGLTWMDVEMLHRVAEEDGEGTYAHGPDDRDAIHGLAGRIAVLLPPREPPEEET